MYLHNLSRCGSIKTCHVQKHGAEIIEVEVWLYFMSCSKGQEAKTKCAMQKMDANVQHIQRNTSLEVFQVPKMLKCTWHVLILPEFWYLNMDMVCFDMDMAHFEITKDNFRDGHGTF